MSESRSYAVQLLPLTTLQLTGLFVANTGSDTNPGTAAQPFATIRHAVSVATSGNINVFSGTYNEAISITRSNITLQGYGPTKPIIDAGGTVSGAGHVIQLTNVSGVTIDGFELTNAVGSSNIHGILAQSAVTSCTITNNIIHGIHSTAALSTSTGIALGTNSIPGAAHNNLIQHNTIYDIGPGGESWGIWMLFTENNTVDGNTLFCCRKESIRDWAGYRNQFTNNHTFLNWQGIELENAVGTYIANNVSHHNVWGYNAKHVNDPNNSDSAGGDPWGVREYVKFWHNTAYKNLHADMSIGMAPAPIADYIDIRDNIFCAGGAGFGTANLNDFRSNHGTNIIVDYNAYQLPQTNIIYFNGFPTETNVTTSLAALQADATTANGPWETHGQLFVPNFADADNGDYSVTNRAALAPGLDLGDLYADQIGAEPDVLPSHSYKQLHVTVLSGPAASQATPNVSRFSNYNDDSFFLTASGVTSGAFVCDFGATTTWNVAWLAIFSQGDPNCPKSIHLDVSDTNNGTDWVEVYAQVNPDNEQSTYKYLLFPGSATGRYVRFRYDSVFGGTQTNVADFGFGLISVLA